MSEERSTKPEANNPKQSEHNTEYHPLFKKIVELGAACGVRCDLAGVWQYAIDSGLSIAVTGLRHAAPLLLSGSQAIIPVLHTALIYHDKVIGFVGPYRCKMVSGNGKDGAGMSEDDVLKAVYLKISEVRLNGMGIVVAGTPGIVGVGGVQ